MAESSPVFIAGSNRSGTSVLRRTLERHPAFRPAAGRSPETRVFVKPRRIFQVLEEKGRPLFRYMAGDAAAAREMLKLLGPSSGWSGADDVHLLRVYFHYAWQARGSQRLLEKTPRHVFHLDRLLETFPGARVVLTIRHPVDVYSSLRKRRQAGEQAGHGTRRGGWQHFTPSELARTWAEVAGIVQRRCQSDAAHCHLLRYEDLSSDPPRRLRELCGFLGEPFHEAALLAEVADERADDGSPVPKARITANPKRWRDFLGEEEGRAIEDVLEPAMRQLGYQRYT
jgi:hypothetical protein